MESIFENLENLNVSEECFNDIMNIVEEIINEVSKEMHVQAAKNSIPSRKRALLNAEANVLDGAEQNNGIPYKGDIQAERKAEKRLKHAEEVASGAEKPKGAAARKRAERGSSISKLGN